MACSMLSKSAPEDYITCPYEESHRIIRSRFQTHLTKCAQAHPNINILICPLNSTHRIKPTEYCHHLEVCSDRIKLDSMIIVPESINLDKFPIPQQVVEAEECWDNVNKPSYDPTKYCENNLILQHTKVAGAAKRRNDRLEQRKKFQAMQGVSCASEEEKRETASDYKKRMPKDVPTPTIVEEQDIFHQLPLMEMIRGGAKTAPIEEVKAEENEDHKENLVDRGFVPVANLVKGRGRHVSKK